MSLIIHNKAMAFLMVKCVLPREIIIHIAKLAYELEHKEILIDSLRVELLLHRWIPVRTAIRGLWTECYHRTLETLCETMQRGALSDVQRCTGKALAICRKVTNGSMDEDEGCFYISACCHDVEYPDEIFF